MRGKTLVVKLVGVKTFKTGNKQYTALFVPKAYSQKPGVNYDESLFCPQCDGIGHPHRNGKI